MCRWSSGLSMASLPHPSPEATSSISCLLVRVFIARVVYIADQFTQWSTSLAGSQVPSGSAMLTPLPRYVRCNGFSKLPGSIGMVSQVIITGQRHCVFSALPKRSFQPSLSDHGQTCLCTVSTKQTRSRRGVLFRICNSYDADCSYIAFHYVTPDLLIILSDCELCCAYRCDLSGVLRSLIRFHCNSGQ